MLSAGGLPWFNQLELETETEIGCGLPTLRASSFTKHLTCILKRELFHREL